MLTPDPQQTQEQMHAQVDAAAAVTRYCQAVLTLLPAYSSLVTSSDLSELVAGATAHAGNWTSGLCAASTQLVPDLFVGFAGAYAHAQAKMLAAEQTLEQNPDDQPARAQLVQQLSTLVAALKKRGAEVSALQTQLTGFQAELHGDHTASAAVIARLANTSEQGVIVSQAQAELGLNFVTSQQLSPCIAIVSLDGEVEVSLNGGPAAGTEIIPAVLVDALLNSLQGQNEQATQALSALGDTWQVVTAKYDSTTTALQQAQDAQVGNILQELDLQRAGNEWRQLAQFAKSLLPSAELPPAADALPATAAPRQHATPAG